MGGRSPISPPWLRLCLIRTLATAVGLQFPSPLFAISEIVRMSTESVLYLKRHDLKNVKQVLRRPMTLLVTVHC